MITAYGFFPTPISARSPAYMSGPLIATPSQKQSRNHALTPLIPTPVHHRDGSTLTPDPYRGAEWASPSWAGDDARMLQDYLNSRPSSAIGAQHFSAVTPGFIRSSSMRNTEDPPTSLSKSSTPRVFFKDQLTETINVNYQSPVSGLT